MEESGTSRGRMVYARLLPRLVLTFLTAFAVLFAFEYVKGILRPDITLWVSHLATILFGSILAACLALFLLRKHCLLLHQFDEEIAERRCAQEALAAERNRLQAILDAVPDQIYVKDGQGRFLAVNDSQARALGGAQNQELLGKTDRDFLPPDLASRYAADEAKILRSGEPLVNREEPSLDVPTGRPIWHLTTKVPVRDQAGAVVGIVGVSRDITLRKQDEEALRIRTQQLEAVRAVGEEIARELDLPTVLSLIHRRATDMLGTGLGSVFLWDEARQLLVPWVVHGRGDWARELVLKLGEGVSGTVAQRREGMIVNDFRSSPYVTQALLERTSHVGVLAEPLIYRGKLLGVLSVDNPDPGRRFTEQDQQLLRLFAGQATIAIENSRLYAELKQTYEGMRRIQDELVHSEKLRALGQMGAGIAHDLNNVLATILGQVELLKLRVADPEIREGLLLLEEAANNGADVVRRIQDFARQRVVSPLAPLELSRIVGEVLEMTRPRWRDEPQRRGIQIEVRTALEGLPPCMAHGSEMREALTNLIFNAADAMPRGGTLTFSGSATGEEVSLTVADTGVGMTEEVRSRVFEPFFTTKGVQGTGLGLSVVYGIMERHRGHVAVASTPGLGTTVTLTFRAARTASSSGSTPLAPTVPRRLLFIDDDTGVRHTLTDLLRAAGHTVVEADGGTAGLARLAENSVDCVITDLGMPEMTGWDVAREVRARHPHLPVILLTGWGDLVAAEGEHQGLVDRILGKPIGLAEILRVIGEVTAQPPA